MLHRYSYIHAFRSKCWRPAATHDLLNRPFAPSSLPANIQFVLPACLPAALQVVSPKVVLAKVESALDGTGRSDKPVVVAAVDEEAAAKRPSAESERRGETDEAGAGDGAAVVVAAGDEQV